jgi:hypothetical protein
MATRLAHAVSVAAGLLFIAACGSGGHAAAGPASSGISASQAPSLTSTPSNSAPATPGTAGGACALVTRQEASTAFGAQSSTPQPAASSLASGKACGYFASANKDSLQVALLTNASPSQLAAIKSSIQLPGAATSTPTGIGDSATVISAGPTAVVIFTKRSNVVVLTLNLLGKSTPVSAVTALAKAAAARV